MDKVLEVQGLTKLYKNGRGINNVTFDIYKGDVFGFLGPNGAGKTTTLKIITGLCRVERGMVKVLGKDTSDNFEAAMQKIGCIIETVEGYEYLSAYKNLQLVARFYPEIRSKRIDEVLELVGLERFKHEKVGSFSLGMKQRLGIAMSILHHPELVILDEPANGLDIEGVFEIRNIIKRLAAEQKITFCISSHLIHEIELVCNCVGVINEGRMLATGKVDELLAQYNTLEEFFMESIDNSRRCKAYA